METFQVLEETTKPDAKRWIFALIEALPAEVFTQVLVTLWAIWFARRQALHENIFQSPMATHMFVTKYLRELEYCKPKEMTARWLLPEAGLDGSGLLMVLQK